VCSCRSPKIIKDDYEALVVSETNKVFPDSVITGCNFYFSQSLMRQLQNNGIQRKQTIATNMQNMRCFGVATYPSIK